MVDNNNTQWHDPLLLTDVPSNYASSINSAPKMVTSEDSGELHQSLEIISPQRFCDLFKADQDSTYGKMMLGFSLTSPDLVVCAGSPDIRKVDTVELPEKEKEASIVLSLEEGINGVEVPGSRDMGDSSNFSSFWTPSKERGGLAEKASFELAQWEIEEGEVSKKLVPVIGINVGCEDKVVMSGGTQFVEDNCFSGGDVIRTVAVIGGAESGSLYQTARFGEFSYNFGSLEPGKYVVDLHFAEIVLTDGPQGMRVFDVFIQDEKVVSGLDIFDRVGANQPLVIEDLEALVKNDEGLSIRLKGVIGNPVLSGISVRKDLSASCAKPVETTLLIDGKMSKVTGNSQLQRDYELQKQELSEVRKAVEELKKENQAKSTEIEGLKKENQAKSTECQEAWRSLRELQNELMRKSMHVGSLAFAIEGQVKEKSKWFSSLNDLKRTVKILKLEHIKLSEEALKYKNCLGDMKDLNSSIQAKLTQQISFHDDLKMKITEGEKERKELYNKVLELKGNIRVFCRCRPLNADEVSMGARLAIDFASARDGEIAIKSNGFAKKIFKFDAVFTPLADQAAVFEDTAPFATSVLDGYNVCIFAYGQTGTGKTFTMEGTENARGVNYRTLAELFRIIDERQKLFKYEISVSVLEVYNEQIRDLLATGTQSGVASKRLEIKQVSDGVLHVPGLVEAHVNDMNEVWDVLQTGSSARAVGSTNANEYSSRSHCIHCVMVKGENLLNGERTKSKLWLVDLAGSERIAKTEVQGERLKEAQNINRSLSALGDVISALANKSPHIPFRNSKLTHLLQDSLGGDSKALMFVQISPNENDLTETLCSLNFASRVKGIELGPARKQLDNAEFLRYKQLVEKTKQEAKVKDVQIKKMEEIMHNLEMKMKEKEHYLEMKMKEKDQKNKNLQEKLKELEAQLLVERKLARQHVDTKLAEQKQQNMKLQFEDQNAAPLRPPLAAKQLGSFKATCDLPNNVSNAPRFLPEHNSYKTPIPLLENSVGHIDYMEKENNPDIVELLPLQQPKKTGRASLCPTVQKIPMTSTPRRNSLIPLPSTPMITQLPPLMSPLPPILADCDEDTDVAEANCLPEQTNCSPKVVKSGTKKLSSVLRRSLQKKVKSPLQQQLRKGGVNVGVEKVRVSIGSRGRMGQRFLLGNGRRFGAKEGQQKRSQREKERGWNF